MAVTVSRPCAVQSLPRKTRSNPGSGVFVDPTSRKLHRQLLRIAASPLNVLIEGETGTGKEVVAREIHRRSARMRQAFIAVNCGAIPAELIESELFGHERGSFTGASDQNKGWFEAADGGTLFLDEVGELPLSAQVSLLRVLQEREITRVGSRRPIPVDVRVIAATNRPLRELVAKGRFRADLFYRLNVAHLGLKPLHQRPGDILPLAEMFMAKHLFSTELPAPALSEEASQRLLAHRWPGNVRELENVIQYALLMADGPVIRAEDLTLESDSHQSLLTPGRRSFFASPPGSEELRRDSARMLSEGIRAMISQGHDQVLSQLEHLAVVEAFEQCGRNQVKTAQLLGITRSVLRVRLKRYGLL